MLGRQAADKADWKCSGELPCALSADCTLKRKCILTDQQFIIEAVAEDLVRGKACFYCCPKGYRAHPLFLIRDFGSQVFRMPQAPGELDHGGFDFGLHSIRLFDCDEHAARGAGRGIGVERHECRDALGAMWCRRCCEQLLRTDLAAQAVKTVSTIEREQLEVDFAKKVLWEMIDKGLVCT